MFCKKVIHDIISIFFFCREHRRNNKRSENWTKYYKKEEKKYPYISKMRLAVVKARMADTKSIRRKVPMSPSDPRRIASTIGKNAPVPTKEIVMKTRLKEEDQDKTDEAP